jgi:hypothetical protein
MGVLNEKRCKKVAVIAKEVLSMISRGDYIIDHENFSQILLTYRVSM